jgi:hypothetical protein
MGIKKYNTIMEKKYDSKFNNFTSTNNNNWIKYIIDIRN